MIVVLANHGLNCRNMHHTLRCLTLVDLPRHGTQVFHQPKFGGTQTYSYQTHDHDVESCNSHEWV